MGIKLAIFGASGLTGMELLNQAIKHPDVDAIYSLGRKKLEFQSDKLVQLQPEGLQLIDEIEYPSVDAVVCCLGTTIKKAGSQDAFREVDVNLPVRIARRAKNNHVKSFIVQSSIGAGPGARGFYLRCKTEMESKVLELEFESTIVLRPSLLLGNRKEFRLGERISAILLKVINPFLVGAARKYRAIHAKDVASAILQCSLKRRLGVSVLESDEIQAISKTL